MNSEPDACTYPVIIPPSVGAGWGMISIQTCQRDFTFLYSRGSGYPDFCSRVCLFEWERNVCVYLHGSRLCGSGLGIFLWRGNGIKTFLLGSRLRRRGHSHFSRDHGIIFRNDLTITPLCFFPHNRSCLRAKGYFRAIAAFFYYIAVGGGETL